nr:WG repeat-containing protein [uncultured Pseudomonas sp.]
MKPNPPKWMLLTLLAVALLTVGGLGYYFSAQHSAGPRFSAEEMNEGRIEDLGTLSMPEAEKRLNYLINDSAGTLSILEMLSQIELSLTVTAITEEEATQGYQYEPLFVPYTSADVTAALAATGKLHFTQYMQGTRSRVRLGTSPLDEIWLRAATPEQSAAERYQPIHLYFRDGSEQALAEAKVETDAAAFMPSSGDPLELPVGKPLAKLYLRVSYRSYPAFKTLVLDEQTPKVELANGEVYQLTALADNAASLTLSVPRGSSYVVQGLTDTGKALHNLGQNAQSMPSATEIAALRAFHEALLQTKDDLDQYPNSQALQKHLETLSKDLQVEPSPLQQVSARYDFEATPQRIVIHVLEPLEEHHAQLQLTNTLPAQKRYIATDPESELAGFVDAAGRWVVKPRFFDADHSDTPGLYLLGDHQNPADPSSEVQIGYYYFPAGSTEPKRLPFDTIEQEINADLLLVQRETNGPYGIYDIKRHRFTLPMRFVNPTVTGNLITARVGELTYEIQGGYGVYTLAGKEILPPRYDEAAVYGDFIYVSSQERSRRDVFDLQGRRINPQGYSAIANFDGEQPLLVQHDSSKRYAFINRQGAFLPFKLPYDEVSYFSSGMAVVTRGEREGAIDLSGKLRIPLDYYSIQPFENDLAIARPAGGSAGMVQIDKDNNWVKRLDTDSDTDFDQSSSSADAEIAGQDADDAQDYASEDDAIGEVTEAIDATEATDATQAAEL